MAGEQLGERDDDLVRFQRGLHRRFGDKVVKSWMADLRVERKTTDCVTLSTASPLKCETLNQRYLMPIRDAWCETISPISKLVITTRERLSEAAARVDALASQPASAVRGGTKRAAFIGGAPAAAERVEDRRGALLDDLSPLNERLTFENFAVDRTNEMAYAAAMQVADSEIACEVVYLHGPSGVGKTHLLQAAGNLWRARNGADGCAYLAYHNVTSGCSNAKFANGGFDSLRKDLLAQRLLLIDDIHLLGGAPRSQTEILNLINASLGGGRRLLIAGEASPAKLAEAGFNDRLTDRLAGGLSVAIQQGGPALRAAVLKKRIAATPARCAIADDAVHYMAAHFPNSTRETLGALNHLLLAYGAQEMVVGVAEAADALRSRLEERRSAPSLEEAVAETGRVFSLPVNELLGRGQSQRLARPRHAFVYVARTALRESFPRIGKALGRDHTTAMSGYRRAEDLLAREAKFRAQVNAIRAGLGLAAE